MTIDTTIIDPFAEKYPVSKKDSKEKNPKTFDPGTIARRWNEFCPPLIKPESPPLLATLDRGNLFSHNLAPRSLNNPQTQQHQSSQAIPNDTISAIEQAFTRALYYHDSSISISEADVTNKSEKPTEAIFLENNSEKESENLSVIPSDTISLKEKKEELQKSETLDRGSSISEQSKAFEALKNAFNVGTEELSARSILIAKQKASEQPVSTNDSEKDFNKLFDLFIAEENKKELQNSETINRSSLIQESDKSFSELKYRIEQEKMRTISQPIPQETPDVVFRDKNSLSTRALKTLYKITQLPPVHRLFGSITDKLWKFSNYTCVMPRITSFEKLLPEKLS